VTSAPTPEDPDVLLRVSSHSNPNLVAGAMAGIVRQAGAAVVQVVGAGALNQAVKAVAIARSYVAGSGIDLVCIPSFVEVDIDGEQRTAIRLSVEHRGDHDRTRPVLDLAAMERHQAAAAAHDAAGDASARR
jgi:stage V sporulation protein S